MKASAFAYARATSVENALELLADQGDRAKVLSGGQSLMPAMNLRLISPELVVDIGGLAELRGIAVKEGYLTIGALTRHVDLLKSPEIAVHAPLLAEAVVHVAHPAIRNRGTIGGSLAHADPASELPACMVALAATIVVRGPVRRAANCRREILSPGFTRQRCRRRNCWWRSNCRSRSKLKSVHFFHEFARRHGDYAIVGLAAQAVMDDGRFAPIFASAFFAVGDRPLLAGAAGKLIDVCRHAGRFVRRPVRPQPTNLIRKRIIRQHLPCAVIWQRC